MKVNNNKVRSQYNLFRVLHSIWLNQGISRIELCERLSIDKATMSAISGHLVSLGIVEEVEAASKKTRPGRKPVGLGVRPDFGYVVGFEYHIHGIHAVIKDIRSTTVEIFDFPMKIQVDQIKTSFFALLDIIIEKYGKTSILGIGVSIPGAVDSKRGIIKYSRRLGIEEDPYDFKNEVFNELDIPGFIDNDANCCVRGLLSDYRTEQYSSALYIHFDYEPKSGIVINSDRLGVGMGIALRGKLYSGPDGTAGEFRTLSSDRDWPCQLNLTKEELELYGEDEPIQRKLFTELSAHLATLVNTMNFQHIFIGGDYPSLLPDLKEILKHSIDSNWPYGEKEGCFIHIMEKDQMSPSLGAAGMFLEQLFTIPDLENDRGASLWKNIFSEIDLLNY